MGKRIIKINEEHIKNIVAETISNYINKNYSLNDDDELMEYMWLRPNNTNLNVDIFVDDGGSYKRHNHSLLLLARNGYDKSVNEFISFSISENPIILNPEIDYNISYNDIFAVQDFIIANISNLIALADENISQQEFVSQLRIPSYVVAERKELLSEMATLRMKDSNLPMDVWLDEGATYVGHAPRLKFRASNDQKTTREFSSMLLTNPPTIENMPENSPLKKKDIKKLENFVISNLDLLLKLANGEIQYTTEFLPNMIIDTTTSKHP